MPDGQRTEERSVVSEDGPAEKMSGPVTIDTVGSGSVTVIE
jgi:hypothetical protein